MRKARAIDSERVGARSRPLSLVFGRQRDGSGRGRMKAVGWAGRGRELEAGCLSDGRGEPTWLSLDGPV